MTEAAGTSDTIAALADALAKAQAAMGHASKDKTNPHFSSKYADLAAVLDAARGPLSSNGLAISQLPTFRNGCVILRTMLLHTSGEYLWSELEVPVRRQDAQGIGSAMTYARRYSLSAIVGIAQDDDDGNGAVGGDNRQPERRPEPHQQEQPPADPPRPQQLPESTRKMLSYFDALDTCTNASELRETISSWAADIERNPRGQAYAGAYEDWTAARLTEGEISDSTADLIDKISNLRASAGGAS